jgi:hypothetical protein
MGILETSRVLATLTDLLSAASSTVVLGEVSTEQDPICEALRRLIDGKLPLVLQREIVPGNPLTVETFNVNSMIMDRDYAGAILDFRKDTAIPESGMNYQDIISRLGQWKKPTMLTGSYAMENMEEDSDDDDDEPEEG